MKKDAAKHQCPLCGRRQCTIPSPLLNPHELQRAESTITGFSAGYDFDLTLSESDLEVLVDFFLTLDRWDRENRAEALREAQQPKQGT